MATKERVEHTLKNTVWTYIYSLVGSVFPFLIRFALIRFLGIEYLGLNSIYAAILQVLNISELGIGQAIGISMYKPVAEGKTKEVNKLISLYSKFYNWLGLGILLIGVLLIPAIPQIVNGEYPPNINICLAYLIYLSQSVLGYFVFPYCNTVFIAKQSVEKVYKYQSLIWIVVYSTQLLVICVYQDYYLYLLLLPVGTVLCGIFNRIGMKKYYPQFRVERVEKNDFEKDFWYLLIKRFCAMALSKVRIVFRNSIDTIIISIFLGTIIAAKYQNYILTMTVPHMLISSLVSGILPSFGNSIALETKESNLAVIRVVTFALHWVGTVFAAFLLCFYQPFMELWAGTEGLLSEMSVILFVGYFYIRVISEISILVRNASGVWWEGKSIAVVETIVNLGLNILFVKIWGVEGIILATIISMLSINIPFETYSVYKHYFGIAPWRDLGKYLLQGLIAFITVFITYRINQLFNNMGGIDFLISIAVCIFVPNIILLIFHWKNEKLRAIINIGINVLKKE